jgi:hypothetical protein
MKSRSASSTRTGTRSRAVSFPEASRHTVQVKLRLPPEVAEDLDAYAERKRVTRSGAIALLLGSQRQSDPR